MNPSIHIAAVPDFYMERLSSILTENGNIVFVTAHPKALRTTNVADTFLSLIVILAGILPETVGIMGMI